MLTFRRISQAVSFALFFVLLLYVAWPYATVFSSRVLPSKEFLPAELFLCLDPLSDVSTAIAGRHVDWCLLWAAGVFLAGLVVPRVFCSHVCPLGTTLDLFHWAVGSRIRRSFQRHPSRRFQYLREGTKGNVHAYPPEGIGTFGREEARPGTVPAAGAQRERRAPWIHTRHYVLAAVLVAALFGTLLSGYVAAIPLAMRGFVFALGPAELAVLKHTGMIRPWGWEHWCGVLLLAAVIAAGLLGRRFWCRYLCPTGALLSLFSLARLRERRVTSACIRCGRCAQACPFDAIRDDFAARPLDCAFCRSCEHACPVGAIEFAWRRSTRGLRCVPRAACALIPPEGYSRIAPSGGYPEAYPPEGVKPSGGGDLLSRGTRHAARIASPSRRGFLGASVAGAAIALGLPRIPRPRGAAGAVFIRPPGSVREALFLDLCVRCGLCIQACPGPVLHPAGLEAGIEALWTPAAVLTWAGCHQDCNFCGQVCPTGAIRPLSIEEKRKTHMGLAVVNTGTCLPHRGERDCQLCYDECRAAGYNAIEMREIRLSVGEAPPGVVSAQEMDEAGRILAPFVDPVACVGCGLCEYRCHTVWKKQHGVLAASAIVVVPVILGRHAPIVCQPHRRTVDTQ
jgi:NAD-dependent dihydropyrimidine dehydrogenase PreA subunit